MVGFIGAIVNCVVVIILLHVFQVFHEINSLEVSFMVWIFFNFGCLVFEKIFLIKYGSKEYVVQERKLFLVFGIDSEKIIDFKTDGIIFHYAAFSLLPAIVAGYTANWFLEERYQLICNSNVSESYSVTLCESQQLSDAPCCSLEYINDDFFKFAAIAFASMLAGYKLVSFVIRILFNHYWVAFKEEW